MNNVSKQAIATAHELSAKLNHEYQIILKIYLSTFDPISNEGAFEFRNDVLGWPKLNLGQIFAYFLHSKAFETEYIGQYKLRKAYSLFESGLIVKIFVSPYDNRVLVKSSVTPSQRIHDKHNLWNLFSSSNEDQQNIMTGYCTCTAGLSSCCNHIAAVLYKIVFANENGLIEPSCTEQLCSWNQPSKQVKPLKVKDMIINELDKSERERAEKISYISRENGL